VAFGEPITIMPEANLSSKTALYRSALGQSNWHTSGNSCLGGGFHWDDSYHSSDVEIVDRQAEVLPDHQNREFGKSPLHGRGNLGLSAWKETDGSRVRVIARVAHISKLKPSLPQVMQPSV
jgi:hypothetical protein